MADAAKTTAPARVDFGAQVMAELSAADQAKLVKTLWVDRLSSAWAPVTVFGLVFAVYLIVIENSLCTYLWLQPALKAFGLQPASEARQFEAGGSGREFKENKSAQAKASAMRNDWVKAKPGPDRNAQWQKIQNWNARNPDNKVTMESLRKLEQRRKRDNAEAARDLNDE